MPAKKRRSPSAEPASKNDPAAIAAAAAAAAASAATTAAANNTPVRRGRKKTGQTKLATWTQNWLQNIGGEDAIRGYDDTNTFLAWAAQNNIPKYLINQLRTSLRKNYGANWRSLRIAKGTTLTEEQKAARKERREQLKNERLAKFPDWYFYTPGNVKIKGKVPAKAPLYPGERRSDPRFGNVSLKKFLRKEYPKLIQKWRESHPDDILVHGL